MRCISSAYKVITWNRKVSRDCLTFGRCNDESTMASLLLHKILRLLTQFPSRPANTWTAGFSCDTLVSCNSNEVCFGVSWERSLFGPCPICWIRFQSTYLQTTLRFSSANFRILFGWCILNGNHLWFRSGRQTTNAFIRVRFFQPTRKFRKSTSIHSNA